MQEIGSHIYMETAYSGVTLGVIAWDHGLILIDAPFKADDTRSWRASLLNMGSSADRMLVNLDAHVDRTLGVRAMDCTVVGHEEIAEAFRSRPLTFKAQSNDTGAEWELHEGIGNTRWAPPEITFTQNLIVHWDDNPIYIEHWPGAAIGSICIRIPKEKIIFLGDIVTPQQPPFLAEANLPAWITALKRLLEPEFSDYLMISGRTGIIRQHDVKEQLNFIELVKKQLEQLASGESAEITDKMVPQLMSYFSPQPERTAHFQHRLQFGLRQYYLHHFVHPEAEEND
jgi:cyclase